MFLINRLMVAIGEELRDLIYKWCFVLSEVQLRMQQTVRTKILQSVTRKKKNGSRIESQVAVEE